MVLLAHAVTLSVQTIHGNDSAAISFWPRLLVATVGSGVFWVWGFFVISGFCIHQSIGRERERASFSVYRYAWARLTRIYPLLLVGLVLAVVSWYLTSDTSDPGTTFPFKSLLGTVFLVQQFTGDFPGMDPAWSLGNEVLYYALWPLALRLCGWRSLRAVTIAGVMSVALSGGVVIVWKVKFGGDSAHWLVPVWCISALFVVWIVGAALAAGWQRIKPLMSARLAYVGVLWLVIIYGAQAGMHYFSGRAFGYMLAAYAAAPGFALLISCGHLVCLGDSVRWSAIASWMGALSYPCYILHMPLLNLMEYAVIRLLPEAWRTQLISHLLIILVPSVMIVSILGVAAERSLMAWRSRFLRALRSDSLNPSAPCLSAPR